MKRGCNPMQGPESRMRNMQSSGEGKIPIKKVKKKAQGCQIKNAKRQKSPASTNKKKHPSPSIFFGTTNE